MDFYGVRLHSYNEIECVNFIIQQLASACGGWVVTANVDILRQCATDHDIKQLVQKADLVVPDGMPLIWASRLQGTRLKERVTGSNLISSLSAAAAENGFSIYLLGGEPGTAEGASHTLCTKNPKIKMAGTFCPPMGFEADETVIESIKRNLCQAAPDIVFVGLPFPRQERLILSLKDLLPRTWWLGVGVSFSFLSGRIRRSPVWMQQIGAEWLHRLGQEPHRLFKRYVIRDIPFAIQLLTHALRTRGQRNKTHGQD